MLRKTRIFLSDVWLLTRPYWRSEDRWRGGALLAIVVGMDLGLVYLNVLFNEWNNTFYNALQEKNFHEFTHQLLRFCVLATIFIVIAIYQLYLRQMLQIRWRRWLTDRYVGQWLGNHAYYRLQLIPGRTDNPDQRIAEDIRDFVGQTLVLSLGLLDSVVTLFSFATILWSLSGAATVLGITIPGYMMWIALGYAVVGTWLVHRIGRPLIGLNYRQQQFEADFRFSLVRLRENAEGVALYGGEEEERRGLSSRFAKIVDNWWGIMRRQKKLTGFTTGYGQIASIFPLAVGAPRYFSGAIELGGLMQISSAFGQVQGALSWFVDAYTSLAAWKATVDRLVGFERALLEIADLPVGASRQPAAIGDGISLNGFDLSLPDGAVLQRDLTLSFPPGSRTLVTGPSGCGKSTLFRAIGGLWPYCRGHLTVPADQRLLFLPQKPYLPIASLRAVVAYPTHAEDHPDTAIRQALIDCGLPHLVDRLDEEHPWAQQLSPGEQQRLAFARALLVRPRWLFLDEATSALDEVSEAMLYTLVTARLSDCTIISIAHRPTVAAFHQRRIDLPMRERPATTVVPTDGAIPAWQPS
jgi:putative ATP-binding cassette transporter